jgi:hypothetical protein
MMSQRLRHCSDSLFWALWSSLGACSAWAHDPLAATPNPSAEITIFSDRLSAPSDADSASAGVVTQKQLSARPLLRTGEVLEAVPGLVATQHAGEGKANQYYLRGFNLDHGTDLAIHVDGVPVNLPTHAHGQGYSDVGFLIPELIESVHYRLGPYHAQDGDFAAAGSVRLRTVRRVNHPLGSVEVGGFGSRRALVAVSTEVRDGDLLLAAERLQDDGPWAVKQNLQRSNLLGKFTTGSAANGWGLGLTHTTAAWTSTDQIPQRAVDAGLISRYGSLDPSAGGQSLRTSAHAHWAHSTEQGQTQLKAYALRYAFTLYSQFTYFTRGCDEAVGNGTLPAACNGAMALDQFAQVDQRRAVGLNLSHRIALPTLALPTLANAPSEAAVTVGMDWRHDGIAEVGLYEAQARQITQTVRRDRVRLNTLGLWAQTELPLAATLKSVLGLRWDHHAADVVNLAGAQGGKSMASIVSPKASLIYSPSAATTWFAHAGRGFHSNDARGTVQISHPATALVAATGAELGLRHQPGPALRSTVALWALRLNSELVFLGDAGTTEPSRPSRRRGLDITHRWQPSAAWAVDADLSLSRARFTAAQAGEATQATSATAATAATLASGNHVPGAMERVASVGITYQAGPWAISTRLRHLGARALLEDNTLRASPSTQVNLKATRRLHSNAEFSLSIFNLFNRQSNDTEYAYASRLPGESTFSATQTPATLHIHPALPRTVRMIFKLWF